MESGARNYLSLYVRGLRLLHRVQLRH
jgi:hypothetical protein